MGVVGKMGYYSSMSGDLKIKKDKIQEFKDAVLKLQQDTKQETPKQDFVWFFFGEENDSEWNVDENGWLEWEDYYQKWYESDDFAKFIKEYVEECEVHFVGEDGERWGYTFDGKGKCWLKEYKEERGEEIK